MPGRKRRHVPIPDDLLSDSLWDDPLLGEGDVGLDDEEWDDPLLGDALDDEEALADLLNCEELLPGSRRLRGGQRFLEQDLDFHPTGPEGRLFRGKFFQGCRRLWRQRREAQAGYLLPPGFSPLLADDLLRTERPAEEAQAVGSGARASSDKIQESEVTPPISQALVPAGVREPAEPENISSSDLATGASELSLLGPTSGVQLPVANVSAESLPEASVEDAAEPKRRRLHKEASLEGVQAVTDKAPEPEDAKKDGAAHKSKQGLKRMRRARVAGAGSPQLPFFAFEWFRDSMVASTIQTWTLVELVERWKELTDEGREEYIHMAQEDLQRFETEYASWKAGQTQETVGGDFEEVLQQRQVALEKKLAQADRQARMSAVYDGDKPVLNGKKGGNRQRRNKKERPPGFPEPSRTAYAFFCKEQAAKLREEVVETSDAPQAETPQAETESPARKPKVNTFSKLGKMWKALSDEEKMSYEALAAKDKERFQQEFETWCKDHPGEGLGEEVVQELAKKGTVPTRLPRPKAPAAAKLDLSKVDPSQVKMGDILLGAALVGLQEKAEEKRKARAEAKENAPQGAAAGVQGRAKRSFGESGSGPADLGMFGSQGDSSLPVPSGVPAAMRPEESVDDLLGGLALATGSQNGEEEEGSNEGDDWNNGALLPRDEFFDTPAAAWADTPEVSGAPKVLGPQLRLDESGNIVLDQSSLTQGLDQGAPNEGNAPVRESVSHYSSAYRKTPACKWSDEETAMFYEALGLYGTDLFLVQTFFRNKSAAQIKSKYSREMKRNPWLVEEALTLRVQRLTKDTFERMHGKIDTSKHYRPPASPAPGEEPEPDGSIPAQEEPTQPDMETPPPEPEYSAEDESLTTNRLMALFD